MSQYMVHYLIPAPPPLCSFVIARPSGVQQTAKRNNLTIPDQMGVSGQCPVKNAAASSQRTWPFALWRRHGNNSKIAFRVGPGGGAPYRSSWDLSVGASSTLPRKQNKLFNKLPPNNHNRHKHVWLKRVLLHYFGEKEALVPHLTLSCSIPKVTFRAPVN